MANPQIENGHIEIANEIAEHLCRYRISGEEWMVLWAIIRKTYGWKKKQDKISLSQFAVMTGLKRQTALRAISKLSSKKIIAVTKNDDSQINIYSFNKDFDEWEPLSKKITVSSKKITTVIKKDNQVSSKMIPTKETITKETITKEIKPIVRYTPDFETFWKSYPRKIGKDKAWSAWKKRNGTRPPVDVIVKAVEIQKKCSQWIRDGGQYIPHPATWINGGRWMDEPDEHPLTGKMSDKTIETVEMLKDWRPPL